MLDLRFVADNPDKVEESLKRRGKDQLIVLLKEVVTLDSERRHMLQKVEQLKARRNQASTEIANLKKSGGDATALLEEMKGVAVQVKALDDQCNEIIAKLNEMMIEFPNQLDPSVPAGKTTEQNVEVRSWGTKPNFSFKPKLHDEIGEALGLLDFKKAGEVAGARFCFVKGQAARIERALISFMIDNHLKAGYEEIAPPLLVNRKALTGTGTLPKFAEDVFHIEKFDYFLIPTAEVPVTNYHRDEILDHKVLPKKYVAFTPCFRSEAGSYGKDTKGLKRQHQFNKVELVKFATPETSTAEHEALTKDAEKILQLLKLPYRVMLLCGGDTSVNSAKTYDLEVWSPGANTYMEISSCSVFTEYQARRASIRYRGSDGKVQFAHTINGSGLAIGRTLIAIMENYQKADGTFDIPDALKSYMGG